MRATNKQPRSFSGVWQIFLYNWHFYAATLALDVVAVFWMRWSRGAAISRGIGAVAAVSTFWALSSLLVSYYVYDLSRLSQWNWLTEVLEKSPGNWANIHAGLDQTSGSLMRLFPAARRRLLDIYVRSEMSEPSIQRARHHAQPACAPETANPFALPLENGECDTVFLIFVAHELQQARLEAAVFPRDLACTETERLRRVSRAPARLEELSRLRSGSAPLLFPARLAVDRQSGGVPWHP
jgi:hypothetical protein